MNHAQFWGGAAAAPYQIEQSLRFDGSNYLNRTPGSAGNRRTWTLSFWFKRGALGTDQQLYAVSDNYGSPSSANYFYIIISGADNKMYVQQIYPGFNAALDFSPEGRVFRDPSAWYHVVLAIDTTQATGSNRQKMWINGELQTLVNGTSGGPTTISQNYDTTVNTTNQHRLGLYTSYYYNGYLAEVNFIDGSALAPTDFGELDDNGVWRPIQYAGSYTGQSWYLKFDAADVDGDSSGLGNDWTASAGISTSGTGTDVMDDTPTTNWCTLNPISVTANLPSGYAKRTPFDGNLSVSFGQSAGGIDGNFGMTPSGGKFYWEVQVDSSGNNQSATRWGVLIDGSNYDIRNPNDIASVANGDILGFAVDANTGTIDYYHNGTLLSNQQTFPSTWKLAVPWMGVTSNGSRPQSEYTFNFGQRAFAYTPPTGFKALNTSNLPAPTVKDGSDYFNTVLWTGDGVSGRAITGVGFQPDFLWIKRRNAAVSHYLQNSVAGATNYMFSDDTVQERNLDDSVDSFDTDGFTLGNDSGTNGSGGTYVGWNWLANGSGSSNTDGSITSTVSANPTAGFSIVTYTGTGSAATVGHGLGVAPNLIIVKSRNYSPSSNWKTYWSVLGDKYIDLNDPNQAYDAGANIWNDTAPTSTVFSIGTDSDTNYSSSTTYVAYCFAEVEGYSKFGSYTGNGTDEDGPFIYTGFAVSWLLVKKSSGTGDWYISDNKRNTYNAVTGRIDANTSDTENTNNPWVDFLSNGFKIRDYDGSWNGSGSTFIYAAFAENPFGGSGVSPATAR